MTVPSPSPAAPSVRELLARVHRARRSGVIEVAVGEGVRRLTMRDGELFLAADHPLAGAVAPLLPLWPPRPESAGGAAQVRGLMARIAFLVGSWEGDARFVEGDAGGDAVGPLPTRMLLMEWAAARPSDDLVVDLGGEGALLAAAEPDDEPAALAARLLDPHAAVLLSRLSRPASVGALLRQAGEARARVLTDLARLRAAGLIAAREAPAGAEAPLGRAVAPDVLRRYAERLGRDLAERPLALDPDSHRSRLADLLARSGGATAYELLGVAADASGDEVHAAYERLARLAHPSHAARLAIPAGERPLWLLFEQATAAYLTLSQPDRRRRYDAEAVAPDAPPVPAERRRDEARQLARSYYERAAALIEAEDFHFAIELLKQAVSSHPRPEYYVLLGRAQAKNPNWLRHAVDSYRRALDLGADDARIAVALGRLCEEMEQYAEAERHYRAAVARDPHDADARAGLARLTGGERKRGALAGLFGRGGGGASAEGSG